MNYAFDEVTVPYYAVGTPGLEPVSWAWGTVPVARYQNEIASKKASHDGPPEPSPRPKPFYRVMGFVVDRDYRNRGIGGEILEKAIALVYDEFGKRSLALGVHKDNTRVGKFYEHHGFRRTGVFEGNDEYYLRIIDC